MRHLRSNTSHDCEVVSPLFTVRGQTCGSGPWVLPTCVLRLASFMALALDGSHWVLLAGDPNQTLSLPCLCSIDTHGCPTSIHRVHRERASWDLDARCNA